MNARVLILCVFIILGVLSGGCARTRVTSIWIKEEFSGPALRSLMILAQPEGKGSRAVWETMIAERYRRSRMYAVPAVSVFPLNQTAGIDKVIRYARENGIEGVLVVRHLDTQTEERLHPPEVYYYTERYHYPHYKGYHKDYTGPYREHYDHNEWYFWLDPLHIFSGYHYYPYGYYYDEQVVVTPGYISYHTVVIVESYLYESGSGHQVMSMSTRTVDPMSVNSLIADVSRSTFRVLRKHGLVHLQK